MKYTFAIALLGASIDARGRSSSSSILELFAADAQFMNFAAVNSKHYETVVEFEGRQNNFHLNMNLINSHNRLMNADNPDDLILAPNYTTDWTPEEYIETLNMP